VDIFSSSLNFFSRTKQVNMKQVYNGNNTEFSVHRTLSVYHGVLHILSVYHTCYCLFQRQWTSQNFSLWPLYCSHICFPDFFNLSSSSNIAKTTSVISFNSGYVKEKSSAIRLSGLCILYAAAARYVQQCFHNCCLGRGKAQAGYKESHCIPCRTVWITCI